MLTPEEIKEKLKDRVISVVVAETGLHANTVRKYKNGTWKNPEYDTLVALSAYFENNNGNV